MTWARPVHQWLVWLFLLGVGVQFFLAGLGVIGGESIDPHKMLGSLLQLLAVLMLVSAALAKMPRPVIIMSVVLVVLMLLQSVFVQIDSPLWLHSFHVFDAFLIAALAQHLAQRAGFPLSSRS